MHELIFSWTIERLDTWLTKQFSYSRNFFHHIITREGILVNGKPAKKSLKLKPWDLIQIDDLERFLSPIILEEAPKLDIPILKETADYLVINKPKGVLSHPNSIRDVAKPSVVWFLYHHFKELPSVWNFIRAGLLHRLDKDTDGLMIIAKTEFWLQHFKKLFQEKSESDSLQSKAQVPLHKRYTAICEITPEGQKFLDHIDEHLPFTISEIVKAKVPNPQNKLWISQLIIEFRFFCRFLQEGHIRSGIISHLTDFQLSEIICMVKRMFCQCNSLLINWNSLILMEN